MSDVTIEDIGRIVLLKDIASPSLNVASAFKREIIEDNLSRQITPILKNYGAEGIFDVNDLASWLFTLMSEGKCFTHSEVPYSGSRYKFRPDKYNRMRIEILNKNQHFITSKDVPRYFEDAFSGYRKTLTDNLTGHFDSHVEDDNDSEDIPAADRLVRPDHNSAPYLEASTKADELNEALTTGNDVGSMTADQVDVARVELSSLQSELTADVLRPNVFWEKAQSILKWIGEKSAGAMVAKLAVGALEAIAAWLGFTP